MRSHLEQTNPQAKFEFLDRMEDLSARLQRIIIDQQRDFLSKQLEDMVSLTKVDISPLVLQRMLPIPENLKDVVVKEEPAVTSASIEVQISEPKSAEKVPEVAEQASVAQDIVPEAVAELEPASEPVVLEIPSKGGKKGKKH